MRKILIALLFFPLLTPAQLKKYSFTQPKMGSHFTITFYSPDSLSAASLADNCFALADSLIAIYSDYLPTSELNLLSATAGSHQWVKVSAPLLDILKKSQAAWKLSSGAFDITVGPIVRLWRKARKENRFPEKDSVAKALKAVGFQYVLIDTGKQLVQLTQSGMMLDLGGIGQGYIAQKVLDYLAMNDRKIALVDASGDIVLGDAPPGSKGWKIGVNAPESGEELRGQRITVQHKAVITSGDVYQYMMHNGKKYSHIVNPRTGYGVTTRRNATVMAADGITADWLATAFTILPLKKIKILAGKLNAEYLIGTVVKGKLEFYRSKGFKLKNQN